MRKFILNLPQFCKWGIVACVDVFIFCLSLFLAFYIRLLPDEPADILNEYTFLFLSTPLLLVPMFIVFGLYSTVLRYTDHHAILGLIKGSLCATALLYSVHFFFWHTPDIPRLVPIIHVLLTILLIIGLRFFIRGLLSGQSLQGLCKIIFNAAIFTKPRDKRLVIIYGAGKAGQQLCHALRERKDLTPVAFIDDNKQLNNRIISGVSVYSADCVSRLLDKQVVEEILLAIPSASRSRKKVIIQNLEHYGLPIRTIPDLSDIVSGRLKVLEVQDVDLGDLLGRDEVSPIPELLEKCIKDKVVLVTGAGGSIGSELCRQIIKNSVDVLILFEISEYALYSVDQELKKTIKSLKKNILVIPVLGSVNEPKRLLDIMKGYKVETIYHTAAYKHVPLVEYNLSQGISNNVIGTLYSAQAAILAGVKNFVLISTDKAVRPSNVMGASKRLAEMVLQGLSKEREVKLYHAERFFEKGGTNSLSVKNTTCFTMVRFGNVLDSSGSVIPVFREQLKAGGPITVTHPDICRYFMTIPEAAQLVIQAGGLSIGGEVFVLDMGDPVKIVDLVKKMVSLSGMTIKDNDKRDGDIEIVYTGLRPGEKLYEELLLSNAPNDTIHPRIFRANEELLDWKSFCLVLDELFETLNDHRYRETRRILLKYVNGFHINSEIVDWLFSDVGKSPTAA